MNTEHRNDGRNGGALVMVLMMAAVASAIMTSYVAYSSQSAGQTMRMIDYQKAQIAAEAALEYGVMQLRDFILAHQFTLPQHQVQNMLSQMTPPPPLGDYDFETPRGSAAFEVEASSIVINGVITNGAACIGSEGEHQIFTVTAGAINPRTGVGAVLQQELQGVGLFLIRYAVFYEQDLEMNPGPSMQISGPVHANGDLYMAPDSGPLYCFDRVTSVGDMFRRRKDANSNIGNVYIDDKNGVSKSMNFDSTDPNWMLKAIQTWNGRVLSRAHGVQHLSPPIADVDEPHDIIERAIDPLDPNYRLETENEKFNNKAALRIHVSSNGVFTATDCRLADMTTRFTNACLMTNGTLYSGRPEYSKTSSYLYRFVTNGAYDVTKTFYDAREGKTMLPVDIYINEFTNCFPDLFNTNYTVPEGRGVLYVTRDDPDGVATGVVPCVRIRNGMALPHGGLTIASDLPIYLEGNYNVTTSQPALVTGDAITFLSEKWQDARSWGALSARCAESTDYYVVVMTGNSPTTWGHYNGGLENVLRFLEGWSGKTCFFRGALIDLWYSEVVTGSWSYGSYYTAPTRNWGYDAMYRSKVPPGMTRVFGLEEVTWKESSWTEVGWN